MLPGNKKKLPESAWKTLFYTCTWSYCVYLLTYSYDYFEKPYNIWDGDLSNRWIVNEQLFKCSSRLVTCNACSVRYSSHVFCSMRFLPSFDLWNNIHGFKKKRFLCDVNSSCCDDDFDICVLRYKVSSRFILISALSVRDIIRTFTHLDITK